MNAKAPEDHKLLGTRRRLTHLDESDQLIKWLSGCRSSFKTLNIAISSAQRVFGACPLPNGSPRRWFRPAGANPAAKLRPKWKLFERRHAWTFLPLISTA